MTPGGKHKTSFSGGISINLSLEKRGKFSAGNNSNVTVTDGSWLFSEIDPSSK
jgi:hypothetical protein